MALSREDHIIKSGGHQTSGPLLQAVALPNGHYLCEHASDKQAYMSVFDPIHHLTLASSEKYDVVWGNHLVIPLSDDIFIFHGKYGQLKRYEMAGKQIGWTGGYLTPFIKVCIDREKKSAMATGWFQSLSITTLTCDHSLQMGRQSPTDHNNWHLLPSGRIVKYQHLEKPAKSKINVFNTPHDEKPVASYDCELGCLGGVFGSDAVALSEDIIVYVVSYINSQKAQVYSIHNLKTGLHNEFYLPHHDTFIFAPLPDNTTLIYSRPDFFILNNQTLAITPIELGLEVQECKSMCYSNGVVALTFKNSDTLYISENLLKQKKEIEDTIMALDTKIPLPLANIMRGYYGFTFFNKGDSSESKEVTEPSPAVVFRVLNT